MSPFTTHQPGGRRARVNERLFFIKRRLIERNNSRIGGGGPAPCAGEPLRGQPVVPHPGGYRDPLSAFLRCPPALKLYTRTWGNGKVIRAPVRGLAAQTALVKRRVLREGWQDSLILQEGALKGLLGEPEKQAPALEGHSDGSRGPRCDLHLTSLPLGLDWWESCWRPKIWEPAGELLFAGHPAGGGGFVEQGRRGAGVCRE